MNAQELWNRYNAHLCRVQAVDLSLECLAATGRARMVPGDQPGTSTFAAG
jgi:hypothetical protein